HLLREVDFGKRWREARRPRLEQFRPRPQPRLAIADDDGGLCLVTAVEHKRVGLIAQTRQRDRRRRRRRLAAGGAGQSDERRKGQSTHTSLSLVSGPLKRRTRRFDLWP